MHRYSVAYKTTKQRNNNDTSFIIIIFSTVKGKNMYRVGQKFTYTQFLFSSRK